MARDDRRDVVWALVVSAFRELSASTECFDAGEREAGGRHSDNSADLFFAARDLWAAAESGTPN